MKVSDFERDEALGAVDRVIAVQGIMGCDQDATNIVFVAYPQVCSKGWTLCMEGKLRTDNFNQARIGDAHAILIGRNNEILVRCGNAGCASSIVAASGTQKKFAWSEGDCWLVLVLSQYALVRRKCI